jgi:heme exporter protein CcmD
MPEFDKYAPYVWWAYGLAAAVLGGLIVWSLLRASRAKRELEAAEKDDNP